MPHTHLTLKAAKTTRNDEFYTPMEEIEAELNEYDFTDKIVYTNCDNPEKSNFSKWFMEHFKEKKLKKYISTFYGDDPYVYIYDGETETRVKISNGSYDSDDVKPYLNEADIIVTNPPFSKIKDFIPFILNNNKDMIFLGPVMIVGYYSVRDYIISDRLHSGYNNKTIKRKGHSVEFETEDGEVKQAIALWYTTLPIKREEYVLTETYEEGKYEFYDEGVYTGYLNVDRARKIPKDYDEPMGVPISFIQYIDRNVWNILKIEKPNKIKGKEIFSRMLIQKKKE